MIVVHNEKEFKAAKKRLVKGELIWWGEEKPIDTQITAREEVTKEIKNLIESDIDFKDFVPIATVICKKGKPLILFHKTKAAKRQVKSEWVKRF